MTDPTTGAKAERLARGHRRWQRALEVACLAGFTASVGASTAGNAALATYFVATSVLFAVLALRCRLARPESVQVRLDVGCLMCARRTAATETGAPRDRFANLETR